MNCSSAPQVVPCRQAAFYVWRPAGGHLHRSHQSQRRSALACCALASPKSDLSAIVIGSGFAGLSAAARLTRDFAQVVGMRSWLGRIQLSALLKRPLTSMASSNNTDWLCFCRLYSTGITSLTPSLRRRVTTLNFGDSTTRCPFCHASVMLYIAY